MKINIEKRREVMRRSQLLGHCICDPRRPCPCDVFRNDGYCPCAGERPDAVDPSLIKLTELVRYAGCASKISPGDLDSVLSRLPAVTDPAVLSGLAAADDAAIYRISKDVCLVQTVDVFTPCVDDPKLFGGICAANCLSDIYAMGGDPRTALSILAFPSERLPGEVMYQMLAGAMAVFAQAGVALVGGHSVKDEEIKLGFAITGLIDPAVAASLEKPCAGDVLVLTKPLGTGVLSFSQQIGRPRLEGASQAAASMAALNKGASEAMRAAGASACTDVTGFGLFAHLHRMLRGSGMGALIYSDSLPAFPGAIDALREGIVPGAIERNREYVGDTIQIETGVDDAFVNLGFDAQTSGGLLIAIPPDRLEKLRSALAERGAGAFVVGKVTGESKPLIHLVRRSPGNSVSSRVNGDEKAQSKTLSDENPDGAHVEGCCADVFQSEPKSGSAGESQRAFAALMRSVQGAGALSERTKELILFSLVLQSRCAPCFEAHFEKARRMGLTQAELDEAAWCAIAMGGATVKMFYQECLERARADQSKTGCC